MLLTEEKTGNFEQTAETNLQESNPDEILISAPVNDDKMSQEITDDKKQSMCNKTFCLCSLVLNIMLCIGVFVCLYFLFPPKETPKYKYNAPVRRNDYGGFKLSELYYMKDYDYAKPKDDKYVNWRNAKNDYYWKNLEQIKKFDFWTDKMKSYTCLNGLHGLNFVPILWKTTAWDTKNKERLRRFLSTYDFKTYGSLFLKPSHMTNGDGRFIINDGSDIEGIIKEIDERSIQNYDGLTDLEFYKKIPMTQDDFKKFIDYTAFYDKESWKNDYRHVRAIPGIIIQKEFDLIKYPEIKFNVVFGRVNFFKSGTRGEDRIRVAEDGTLTCDVPNGCNQIMNLMDWGKVIPKIEGFANHIHIEMLRVDIFPRSENEFYINEIETLSSNKIDKSEEKSHPGVVEILKQKNQEIQNSDDQSKYFLEEEGGAGSDFLCDIQNLPISNF
jgi:hypothetical protein